MLHRNLPNQQHGFSENQFDYNFGGHQESLQYS